MTDSNPIDDAWLLITRPTRIEGNHVVTHYALPTKNGMFQIWQQGLLARWQYRYVLAQTGKVVFKGIDEGYDTLDDAKQAVRTVKQGFGIQQGGLTSPT